MEMIINRSDDYANHVTVTDNSGVEYRYSISKKRVAVSSETVLLDIRNREYPDAPKEAKQDFETMEQWIADGALDDEGNPVAKVPWTGTHPAVKNKIIDVIEIDQEIVDLYKQIETAATASNDQIALGILQLLKKIFWGLM